MQGLTALGLQGLESRRKPRPPTITVAIRARTDREVLGHLTISHLRGLALHRLHGQEGRFPFEYYTCPYNTVRYRLPR